MWYESGELQGAGKVTLQCVQGGGLRYNHAGTGVCYLLSQGLTERRSGMEWQIKL